MRILIIDPNGNGLDLAMRCQQHGHTVKLFIRNLPKNEFIGKGLVDRVGAFERWLPWADLVFNTDNTYYVRQLDQFKAQGGLVISPSESLAEWEMDRDRGTKIFRQHGIAVPVSTEFNDYDKAIAFVKSTGGRFVSKPSGDADKALSYCSHGASDMIFMLERWKKLGKLKAPFILQEFHEGIEMAVGAWFGPSGFDVFCENFEFKKLCNGDLGCQTGEQGTVLRYVRKSKLAEKVLLPLERTLLKEGYVGYVDVNCIIDEHGDVWPLEFTMRPGWPTFNIQEPLHESDTAKWLTELASGIPPKVILDRVAIGVVLTIPDYPYSHLPRQEVAGIPIYGLDNRLMDHIHPGEMMAAPAPDEKTLSKRSHLATAGDYILVMTATSETISSARRTVYARLKKLSVPASPMWRTDIGLRLKKQLPKLQALGYATGMTFGD